MNPLDITVVGCGDAFASGNRLHTCFHVHSPKGTFLIDCGASAYVGLKQNKLDLAQIDTIFISHFHGDHYAGVAFVLLDLAIHHPQHTLTIVSPPGGREKITTLLNLLYPGTDVLGRLRVKFLAYEDEGELDLLYMNVKAVPVEHNAESLPYGLRIQLGEKIIGFSGDTSWTDRLITLAKDADLFICECNFYSTSVPGHMTYLAVQEKIAALPFKKILLTHLDDEMLANVAKIDLPIASDGMRLTI